jgi:O-antigen ligase
VAGVIRSERRVPLTEGFASITRWRRPVTALWLALLGAALGFSQMVNAAYAEATWSVIALGALALALALVVGVPRPLPLAALLPLLGLWVWSYLSAGWSDSAEAAHTAAARWLLYAATLALLWWAIGDDRRRAAALLTGAAAGVLGVAGWMLAEMLGGDGAALFLGTRLNDPLGYINGQAGCLLVGAWPCLALAELRGTRNAIWAGAGVAGVVVVTSLGLLTQSRSWAIALVLTTLGLLAAVPGRPRRAAAVGLCGATMALLYAPLADVWRHPLQPGGVVAAAATRHAAVMIVLGALAAGSVWGIAVFALERLAPRRSRARTKAARFARAALAVCAALGLIAIAVNATTIKDRVESRYDAFVHLAPTGGGTRLASGGGNRYDYWRVAAHEFRAHELRGVGAGNYQPGYYADRRTSEDIQQPHSLELQTLAELGLVGAVLLTAFLVAVGTGFVRTARAAAGRPTSRTVAVAAGGVFAGWLIQTSVDWLHLLPGLTAIALAAAAALLVRPGRVAAVSWGRCQIATIVLAAVIACAGTVTIAPRVLSLHARASAQRALADRQPRMAIADATRALDYDPDSVAALGLRAAGFAQLHAFAPTLADTKRAIALEPRNWVTWALLGDLLTRRGDRARARSAYRRAVALNPRNAGLRSALRR